MEIPTPPGAHRALRTTESWSKDKKQIFTWITGVLASAAVAGVGWAGTHILATESVNAQQDIRIRAVEDRAQEDRNVIREQLREQSDKLDRIMERIK
jgi:hypothetical protein